MEEVGTAATAVDVVLEIVAEEQPRCSLLLPATDEDKATCSQEEGLIDPFERESNKVRYRTYRLDVCTGWRYVCACTVCVCVNLGTRQQTAQKEGCNGDQE